MPTYLDFEKPIAELESRVAELRALTRDDETPSIGEEITSSRRRPQQLLVETYAKLNPWQKTQVARHPDRPHCLDYIDELIEDFTPLAGDRYFAEDAAIMGGLGTFRGRTVVVIGHEKGHDTETPHQAQLRHGAARGLSQGRAPDGDGRALRRCR